MKKYYAVTLGCKINQYETEAIGQAWEARGLRRCDGPREAGVILVNSCAVTAGAMADLRQAVRRLHRENPEAGIVLTGCAAQVAGEDLAGLPGVVRVVPQRDKIRLLDPEAREAAQAGTQAPAPRTFPPFRIGSFGRARAVLKVQDGCSHACAYCIVPRARGPSVSRDPAETLAEARRLLAAGVREMVLSGVNLGQYGRDLAPAEDFWDLVSRLEAELAPDWAGRARLRISSLEPSQLNERGLEALSRSRLVCPHLHLSLQSASPAVLEAMGRNPDDPERIETFLKDLARIWPLFGLGADLLTGFPGETGEQFRETLGAVERLPLSYAHVFPYSPRPGTRAARMAGQTPKAEKTRRAGILREAAAAKRRAFLVRLAGLDRLEVLVEKADPGEGTCSFYGPCRFDAPLATDRVRRVVRARPVRVEGDAVVVAAREGA